MDDLNAMGEPLLNIAIPSWRLGTPRFTLKGTAQLRGSSYAPTEDFRASRVSMINQLRREMQPVREFSWNRPAGAFMLPEEILANSIPKSPRPPSPLRLRAMRSAHLSSHLIIEPDMFTELTFRPTCDDRAIVRYSSTSGAVTAATPPRLVAEITSPSFLDYELISDFFLTYRAFLDPLDLLRMLFARMRWALSRQDEVGMIVRVRTFVATRHWILNYFADDFALNYDLRKNFCELLNGVVDDLSEHPRTRQAQLRVIAELKKCWRRVCAHYWDGPDFDDSLTVEAAVAPGGIAGYRDPNLTPADWEEMGNKPPQSPTTSKDTAGNDVGFSTDPAKTPNIGDFVVLGDRPLTPEHALADGHGLHDAGSPLSMASLDVISCSFHGKALKNMASNPNQLWAAHPVPSTATIQPHTGAIATTPRALVGKRVRPAHSHKRSNSVSDSLREHCSDRPLPNEVDFPTPLPSAGSLVRGNILPPGQAFVDVSAQDCGGMAHRQTTVFQPPSRRMFRERALGSAMSGSGMRKLLSSVRRALSARGLTASPTQATFSSISPVGPPGAASNRLPGTAVVPQERTVQAGNRPAVRIDLLGAEVAEDFKNAVRDEQGAITSQPAGMLTPPHNHSLFVPSPADHQETNSLDWFQFDDFKQRGLERPMSDAGITNGSKSIVIVDDTIPFEPPASMRITLGRRNSAETFADSFMGGTGDPTPPNTPPANFSGGTPRRSSYLLNQQIMQPDDAPLPPFVPDLTTLRGDARMSEEQSQSAVPRSRQGHKYPPLSGGTFRMHRRTRSSRTHQSLNSILQKRQPSFTSSIAAPSTIRSFDATTVSGQSAADDDQSEVAVPEPLRVLRRRPGGDLRAANHVEELQDHGLTRSRSVGSLVTYSESIRSSSFFASEPEADDAESDYGEYHHQSRQEVFSLGQLTKQPPKQQPKRDLSLFSTHSSKPNMRPSFEAEAQRLAQIPDDEDDGGIESALLKLEGKFSKKPKTDSSTPAEDDGEEEVDMAKISEALQQMGGVIPDKTASRRIQVDEPATEESHDVPIEIAGELDECPQRTPRTDVVEVQSFLSEASHQSYNSIPLLNRGLTDDGGSKRSSRGWADKSILRDSVDEAPVEDGKADDGQHLSYDFIEKTNSIERIQPGETVPSAQEDESFLEDESLAETEISSEMSVDETTPKVVHVPLFHKKMPSQTLEAPVSDSMLQPVSPPLSTPRQAMSPNFPSQPPNRPLPPTPETTPTAPQTQTVPPVKSRPSALEMPRSAPRPDATAKKYSVHLPFILAFDSDILAQQFTLIEKDALNEIDWKDLIEMNWKNATSSSSRSWVEFLRNTDAHGVEVVIARFNIMVKWAISEIVLTQHVEERARCIIKMIHIAAHCRRYRNFATLAQLTIALSSNEVARLSRTWNMVPAHDMRTLAELENLVTPTRNFFNLRAEMEVGTDNGCIPFVGIYTHDLLYNAQRPSEIASSPVTAPLVNFERSRIAASVVKVLLRLLESSTHYSFQPLEGLTERCLWVGALHDDDIRRHSETLE